MSDLEDGSAPVADLERLLQETYDLWEAGWVGFNWRGYTYDHVQRVRGLALNLGGQEGADADVLALSGLLHDITKPYDGPYITDATGKRVVDAEGYWRNEPRPPSRSNAVTDLYDALGLAGQPHNRSGARMARVLLERRGLPDGLIARVAVTIEHHLRPPQDAPPESRCLYDADTIDANIGLPAFVRNIYINLHFHDLRHPDSPPIAELLERAPLAYLRPYISEQLPTWAQGKRRDFIPRLLTDSGCRLALERLGCLRGWFARFARELEALGQTSEVSSACLDVLLYYMRGYTRREDPSIARLTDELADCWEGSGRATLVTDGDAADLVRDLRLEMSGAR